jgi:hypothetical protein
MSDAMADAAVNFSDDVPCPCGSGKVVVNCPCKRRHFVPTPVNTRPGRIVSGMRVLKCYAHLTRDCGGSISADHALAESIADDFGRTPITRILADGATRSVPPSAAGRNVLCRRHNSALSSLDQVGRRFVRALGNQIRHWAENSPEQDHVLFNGFDVERWMLKVLCTAAYDEPASRVNASEKWQVPRSWLRVLFEGHALPPGAGLYTPRVARDRFNRGILTAKIVGSRAGTPRPVPLLVDGKEPVMVLGISMSIYGQDFDLHMVPPSEKSEFWYRIRMYRTRTPAGGVSHVHLGWDGAPPSFNGKVAAVDRENPRDDLLR